jgi:hypothetical protein
MKWTWNEDAVGYAATETGVEFLVRPIKGSGWQAVAESSESKEVWPDYTRNESSQTPEDCMNWCRKKLRQLQADLSPEPTPPE